MKNLIFILLIAMQLFFINIVSAQTISLTDTTIDQSEHAGLHKVYRHIYITDKNNQKFIGTWAYKQDNKIFTIKLKDSIETLGGFTMNTLVGGYDYFIDGKPALYSSAKNKVSGLTNGELSTIELGISNPYGPTHSAFQTYYILTYIDSNTLKLDLSKKPREWTRNNNDLLLPLNIILHRE